MKYLIYIIGLIASYSTYTASQDTNSGIFDAFHSGISASNNINVDVECFILLDQCIEPVITHELYDVNSDALENPHTCENLVYLDTIGLPTALSCFASEIAQDACGGDEMYERMQDEIVDWTESINCDTMLECSDLCEDFVASVVEATIPFDDTIHNANSTISCANGLMQCPLEFFHGDFNLTVELACNYLDQLETVGDCLVDLLADNTCTKHDEEFKDVVSYFLSHDLFVYVACGEWHTQTFNTSCHDTCVALAEDYAQLVVTPTASPVAEPGEVTISPTLSPTAIVSCMDHVLNCNEELDQTKFNEILSFYETCDLYVGYEEAGYNDMLKCLSTDQVVDSCRGDEIFESLREAISIMPDELLCNVVAPDCISECEKMEESYKKFINAHIV